jgi:multicomponent Na+:H+ antiporter subunit D
MAAWIGLTGSMLQLALAIFLAVQVKTQGILVLHTGNWEAPFGITLVVDAFSSIMLVLTGIIAVSVSIYSLMQLTGNVNHFFSTLWCKVC